MLSRSTRLHLRIPFSVFLMPVFCFAVAQPHTPVLWRTLLVFVVLHLFLYPASNGYNSYFDKDEDSIGGLEVPPPVDKELYYVALGMDGLALLLAMPLGWQFMLMLLVYGLISKAYSHPLIRLKKYPVISLLAASLFQGGFTYLMVYMGARGYTFHNFYRMHNAQELPMPILLSTLMVMGFYPMTQIYQHEEDARRGDRTLSRLLGVQGTFAFSGLVFLLADAGFLLYFGTRLFVAFQLFMAPLFFYFTTWYIRSRRDACVINFKNTMRLNLLASISLISFFLLLGWVLAQE